MTSAVPIKVGMPVSYDYAFLYQSLPLIYEHADRITLAVDPACRTWTGIPFAIANSSRNRIRTIDVCRDEFYRPGTSALVMHGRERSIGLNILSRKG